MLALLLAVALEADTIRIYQTGLDAGAPVKRAGIPAHALPAPKEARFRESELMRAELTIEQEVARGSFPGAALAIGRGERTAVERGIGRLDWSLGAPEVDPDRTLYDLASLTKVVATTTAVMLLVEDGRIRLDSPVSLYLPAFQGDRKEQVTIRDLLTHTSGLPAGADIWARTPEQSLARAIAVPLKYAPGQLVEYSDIGFVVLYAAAEAAAGERLHRLLDRRVFGPLGMRSTAYLPGEWCTRCAPTELRKDGREIRGVVHDPTARRLAGLTGNAGLFSTVHDLTRFAAMIANGGELGGVRVLKESTIREFTRRQPGARTRALGWDTPSASGSGAAGVQMSPNSFGHTGFTGTSLWVDADRGTWVVLLSNRTYQPKGPNRMQAVRRSVHDWVASSADRESQQQ